MAFTLFGFEFRNPNPQQKNLESFVPPNNDDGASVINQGGTIQQVMDLNGKITDESELIKKYQQMSLKPEVESAIAEIVNEAIITEEKKSPIAIVTDSLRTSPEIIQKIQAEFKNIMNLLDFNKEGQDIFRNWYIDGRLYYQKIIDTNRPQDGIQELRKIDPTRIKPIIEVSNYINSETGAIIQNEIARYYVYNEFGIDNSLSAGSSGGSKIAWDSICYVHSGIKSDSMILSHLNKALKPSNLLTMVEDASIIYRLSRAPSRRIFYIDIGTLPKPKAEAYMKDIMNRYRNKMVFNATTGEVSDDKQFLSFMEDYWLPRREGSRGTEIDTLPGAENLGEMTDVEYFKEKLYQSLNVPVGRLKSDSAFNFGRSAEITRDEVKFGKFIYAIRNRFTLLFDDLLSTQLMLKGVITRDDWDVISQNIFYSFLKDTYFSELKNLEITRERLGVVDACLNYVGKYFSHQYVRRNILQQTEEDMKQLDIQMAKEKNDPRYQAIEALTTGMPPGMDGSMSGDPSMQSQLSSGSDPNIIDGDIEDAPQDDDTEDEAQDIGISTLPTDRITKNVEKLWRRD